MCRLRNSHQFSCSKTPRAKQFSECSWQRVKQIADKLLVHARLPPIFFHHALLYAVAIFNVIPVKKLVNKNGFPVMTYELFLEKNPELAILEFLAAQLLQENGLSQHRMVKELQTRPSNAV